MAKYDWLAQKKADEMAKKMVQRGAPNYRQMPISERYGATFTGMGPDGKLDRNSVAGIETDAAGRQHAYHEGEAKFNTPEGALYINSDMMKMMGPQTSQNQAEQNVYAKKGNLPGFASGGFAASVPKINVQPKIPDVVKAADPTPAVTTPKVETLADKIAANPSVLKPSIGQIIDPGVSRYSDPNTGTRTSRTPSSAVPTEATTVSGGVQRPINPSMPAGSQAQIFNPMANAGATETSVQQPVTVGQRASTEAVSFNQPTGAGQTETSVQQPVMAGQRSPAEPGVFNAATAAPEFTGTLTDQAAAITPKTAATPYELEGRRATDEQAMRQQQERSALEQRLIQQGVSPDRARLEGQLLRNTQESELANTAAGYGVQNAAFKAEEAKYKDTQDWKAYETAIAAGDFTTAASAYQRVTGKPISMDQMKTYQNYQNSKNTQDLTSGDIAIEAQRLGVNSSQMNQMISDINNGVPLATINSTYGTTLDQTAYDSMAKKYSLGIKSLETSMGVENVAAISDMIGKGLSLDTINTNLAAQGKPALSAADYNTMYESTPLGERNWSRKESYARTLLEMGGTSNIEKFAQVFDNLYGGTGIDVGNLITDDNAATFAKGQSTLAKYASAMTDFSAIPAQELATIKKQTGMNDSQIETLYKSMNVNAIDQQMDTLTSSNAFKSLKPELQGVLQDTMMYQALGIKGFLYGIKDSSGKIIQAFDNATDAASWMSQNGGKGYSMGVTVDQGETPTNGTSTSEEGSTTDESTVTIPKTPLDRFVDAVAHPIKTLTDKDAGIMESTVAGARAGLTFGPLGAAAGMTAGLLKGVWNAIF
jgi:hypothetical protein